VATQPTPTVTHADVDRVVRRDFPADNSTSVFALLTEYGTEQWHRETDRVRLAALKLAAGDIVRLRAAIEMAKRDYRDILAAAEYPEYSQNVNPSEEMAEDEMQRLIDSDWRQYSEWLAD